MPALFEFEMALAACDPSSGLAPDGSSWWSVHYFDRRGVWTASAMGMSRAEAIKKARNRRRRARKEALNACKKK
jgi:hypothetical protein